MRRIKADPRVALTVYEGVGVAEAWVSIEGRARLETDGTVELVKRLADAYYPPARAAVVKEEWVRGAANWVTIVITPERIKSYRTEW